VEIHRSARRHSIADADMLHAIDGSLAVEDVGEDPDRWLVIGPDTAGNLLELVVLVTSEGDEIASQVMLLRPVEWRLLDP
jgi:hypothetical protein